MSSYDGTPCRHEFAVYIQQKNLKDLYFHQRWTRDYYSPQVVPDVSPHEENNRDENEEEKIEEIQEKKEEGEKDSIQNVVNICIFFSPKI